MVWEKVNHKPPYSFDEEEDKDIDEKVIKEEQENFTKEILSGIQKAQTTKPKPKGSTIVFDSSRDNTK